MAVYWPYAYVGYALTNNRMKRLDDSVVRKIFSLHKKGKSEREIARELSISRSAVWGWLQKGAAALAMAVLLLSPAASSAAVYEYVNTSGQLLSVEANSLAEAEALAVDRAPNSGFLLSSSASAPAPASSTDTIAALRAQIASLQAQLAALLAQQEDSAGETGDAITDDMAKDEVASSTPEQVKAQKEAKRAERSAKKEVVKDRGVAIAKAHVYADEDLVRVSLTDYVEGDEVSVSASLNGEDVRADSNEEDCGGKVAKSDLKICSKEVAFPAPEDGELVITIAVEGVEKSYSIGRGGRNAWLSWE